MTDVPAHALDYEYYKRLSRGKYTNITREGSLAHWYKFHPTVTHENIVMVYGRIIGNCNVMNTYGELLRDKNFIKEIQADEVMKVRFLIKAKNVMKRLSLYLQILEMNIEELRDLEEQKNDHQTDVPPGSRGTLRA